MKMNKLINIILVFIFWFCVITICICYFSWRFVNAKYARAQGFGYKTS